MSEGGRERKNERKKALDRLDARCVSYAILFAMAFGTGWKHTMTARKKATPKTGNNDLAKKIMGLRSRLGLTQEQFAAKVGVTFSTVNRWESGKSKPSPLAAQQIQGLTKSEAVPRSLREAIAKLIGSGRG